MPQDKIWQKKQQAQKQALKVVKDAWDGDRKIDADLAARGEKIRALEDESAGAKKELAAYEEEKETLRESYGVSADSEEQKDLELLLKQREAERVGSGVQLTKEGAEQNLRRSACRSGPNIRDRFLKWMRRRTVSVIS